jgi:hypothetical protein
MTLTSPSAGLPLVAARPHGELHTLYLLRAQGLRRIALFFSAACFLALDWMRSFV